MDIFGTYLTLAASVPFVAVCLWDIDKICSSFHMLIHISTYDTYDIHIRMYSLCACVIATKFSRYESRVIPIRHIYTDIKELRIYILYLCHSKTSKHSNKCEMRISFDTYILGKYDFYMIRSDIKFDRNF